MDYLKCPHCGRKALQPIGNLYRFNVKEWRTVMFITYKCRWCRRKYQQDEAGNISELTD